MPEILFSYEDERVALKDVIDSIRSFLLSEDTEMRLVRTVGLEQAGADYSALMKIFEISANSPKARLAPDQEFDLGDAEEEDAIRKAPKSGTSPAEIEEVIGRPTSQAEVENVVSYWRSLPCGSELLDEASLRYFLRFFPPERIRDAMRIATSKSHPNYFKYLCGILHNWRRELEAM